MANIPLAKVTVNKGYDVVSGGDMAYITTAYFSKAAEDFIHRNVLEVIQQQARTLILEDPELRARVKEAIEVAASSMPLEAIADSVKKAIADYRLEELAKK